MPKAEIIQKACDYVDSLFDQQLPPNMYFHDLQHTHDVFDAVREISAHCGLDHNQLIITQLAAIFHDTGYLYHYEEHEDNSKIIASNYLMQQGVDFDMIEQVVNCISATKVPQRPQSLVQQVMCDADLFHFARPDYLKYAGRLKKEWAIYLGKVFTDAEWTKMNLEVLIRHSYFTYYGQNTLQKLKQKNIDLLQFSLEK